MVIGLNLVQWVVIIIQLLNLMFCRTVEVLQRNIDANFEVIKRFLCPINTKISLMIIGPSPIRK